MGIEDAFAGAIEGFSASLLGALEAKVALAQAATEQERIKRADELAIRKQDLAEKRLQVESMSNSEELGFEREKLERSDSRLRELATSQQQTQKDIAELRAQTDKDVAGTRAESRRDVAKLRPTSRGELVDFSGFTLQEKMNARNFVEERFGGVLARRDSMVLDVLKLTKEGKSLDGIEDEIRRSEVSEEFRGPIRQAFRSLSVSLSQSEKDNLENAIDQALEAGDTKGAYRELISGFVKTLGAGERKSFTGRQQMLSSLTDIKQTLKALEAEGVRPGPGTAIKEWAAAQGRTTANPEVRSLVAKMNLLLTTFRRTFTGLVFSDAESKLYEGMLPGIDKDAELNESIMEAMISTNLRFAQSDIENSIPNIRETIDSELLNDFLIGSVPPSQGRGAEETRTKINESVGVTLTEGSTVKEGGRASETQGPEAQQISDAQVDGIVDDALRLKIDPGEIFESLAPRLTEVQKERLHARLEVR